MKRYSYSMEYPTTNTGKEREIVPIHVMETLPGDSIELSFMGEIGQATTYRNYMSRARYRWASFWYPHRLAWDGWEDYFTGENIASTPTIIPTATTDGFFFDTANNVPLFMRATYQAIYNEFYRKPSTAESTLAPAAMVPLLADRSGLLDYDYGRTPDDSNAVLIQGAVSGTDVTLNMDLIAQGLARRHDARRVRETGDRYVDALRQYGIDASYAVTNRPEVLGGGTFRQGHGSLSSTSSTDLGDRVTTQGTSIKGGFPRKQFAEHGTILTVLISDPHSFNGSKDRPLGIDYETRDMLYSPSKKDMTNSGFASTVLSSSSFGTLYHAPWQRYRQGEELCGRFYKASPQESWVWGRSVSSEAALLTGVSGNNFYFSDHAKSPAYANANCALYQVRTDFKVRRLSQVPPLGATQDSSASR